jgi:hypothetical protein
MNSKRSLKQKEQIQGYERNITIKYLLLNYQKKLENYTLEELKEELEIQSTEMKETT